jgi:hypothetical protein
MNTFTTTSTKTTTITTKSTTTRSQTATTTTTATKSWCQSTTFDAKDLGCTNCSDASDGSRYIYWVNNSLYCSSYPYAAALTMLTVLARGDVDQYAGVPSMAVSAPNDNNVIGTAIVTSKMTPYSFTFNAAGGNGGFAVEVASGAGVYVKSVTVSCPTTTVTATATEVRTNTAEASTTTTATVTGTSTVTGIWTATVG